MINNYRLHKPRDGGGLIPGRTFGVCDAHIEDTRTRLVKGEELLPAPDDPAVMPCFRCNPPITRATDPSTSHAAAKKHEQTKLGERQWQVLSLVLSDPDLTNGEYARLMVQRYPHLPIKIAVETPHKRLSDLHHKGFIEVSGERPCRDSGYDCQTYRATDLGRSAKGP